MKLEEYLRQREQRRIEQRPKFRSPCAICLQPERTCYCLHIQSFDPKIRFVILIHRLEVRRRVATGRMSHLCLKNSELLMGYDYSEDPRVNAILQNPKYYPVILYPGSTSTNLSLLAPQERSALFPQDKELVVFVIDGTWSTAGKTLRRSKNLHHLPRICFNPSHPSRFYVRQQPKANCFSTLEAIHQTIEMVGPVAGFDVTSGEQNRLLYVFDKMVEQQLEFIRQSHKTNRHSRHQRAKTGRIQLLQPD